MTVTHTPKAGATLTGTEYESATHHVVAITHAETTGQTATDHHPAPAAGPDANVTIDSAGAAGTASTFARSGHGHQVVTTDAPSGANITIDTAATAAATGAIARAAHGHRLNTYSLAPAAVGTAAAGTSTTAPARGDHVHATGAGTPSTQAFGDAAATGTGPAAAMTDHKHAMPANPVSFATPAVVLGTAAAAGAASTVIRSDATIVAFDATTPANVGTAATGSQAVAARRDHVHATGAGTPSTSAEGDAAATGTGPAAAMTDHKHARATATRKVFLPAAQAKLDSATAANLGASANLLGVVAYADAATQGAFWTLEVPADWVSGVITVQMVWVPGATDGTAHTVRWSMTCKTLAAGVTVTAAGTTVAFTGASSARTINVIVYDTATSTTLTPAAAGDLFMIEVQRIGADAADTYVGVVNLVGLIVSYTANT